MNNSSLSPTVILSLSALFAATGCGSSNPPTFPVTGIVRYPDGQPVSNGTVEFDLTGSDESITATGVLNADGRFELETYKPGDGARPGKHRVAVFSNNIIGSGYERPGMIEKSELDPRFSDVGTSGLEFVVEEKPNEFSIEVDYLVE